MNPYNALGVESNSTLDDIKKAYRDLVKKYHPDLNPDDIESAKRFKEIQHAYEILTGQSRRTNTERSSPKHNPFDFDFSADLFGSSTFKGKNVIVRLEIDLLESISGCKKFVKAKKRKRCDDCDGQGCTDFLICEQCSGNGFIQAPSVPFTIKQSCPNCAGLGKIKLKKCDKCAATGFSSYEEKDIEVEIPSGIQNNAQLSFAGDGEESVRGGRQGDLIIIVKVKDDPLFKREGSNLHIEVPVSYTQLALGCELLVPSIFKERLIVKIPQGCQPQTKFKVKGKGVLTKAHIGDMIVSLKLEIPRQTDDEYKSTLKELSAFEQKNVTPQRQNWLNNLETQQ
jgi:molecular chaperone DnaJ